MEKLVIIQNTKDELNDTVSKLERITKELAETLISSNVVACKFVTIPHLTMEEEMHRLLNGPPRFIKVNNAPLNAGLHQSVSNYYYFYTEYGMSTRFSPNFPGIICIKDAPKKVIELVDYSNTLKLYFSAVLKNMKQSLKPYYEANGLSNIVFETIHSTMPMLLTECVVRKINVQTNPVDYASFSMRANSKKNLISLDALDAKLREQLKKADTSRDKELVSSILKELSIAKNSGFKTFGYPKSTSPTPSLTIHFRDGAPPMNYRACLPLIVLNQGDVPPRIYDMANYDLNVREQRKKRKTTAEPTLLYPRTGLYGFE